MAEIPAKLSLTCAYCDWVCPENVTVGEVALIHFQLEHGKGEGEITMNLAPICTCGKPMLLTHSDPVLINGLIVDHFRCPNCLNTTRVSRGATNG